jgi:hypothetical protein
VGYLIPDKDRDVMRADIIAIALVLDDTDVTTRARQMRYKSQVSYCFDVLCLVNHGQGKDFNDKLSPITPKEAIWFEKIMILLLEPSVKIVAKAEKVQIGLKDAIQEPKSGKAAEA